MNTVTDSLAIAAHLIASHGSEHAARDRTDACAVAVLSHRRHRFDDSATRARCCMRMGHPGCPMVMRSPVGPVGVGVVGRSIESSRNRRCIHDKGAGGVSDACTGKA